MWCCHNLSVTHTNWPSNTMFFLLITLHTSRLSWRAINNLLSSSLGEDLVKKLLYLLFSSKLSLRAAKVPIWYHPDFVFPLISYSNVQLLKLMVSTWMIFKTSFFILQTYTPLPSLKMQPWAPQWAGSWQRMETLASMPEWPTVWRMTWGKTPLLSSKQTQWRRREWFC